MGLFNFGNKKKNVNSNDEIEQWDNFCRLDESFKNDIKLKPIYYLKLYGKNMINSNSEIKNKAKTDFIQAILDNIKSKNNSTIKCIIDYLINKYDILDNGELIGIINNLDKDSLETIANSHSFLSFVQMRNQINNINNNEIKKLVEPLVNALNNKEIEYKIFISKYSKELRDYIYKVYNIMMNEKFEAYKFNGNKSNIYFYGYKLVVVFDEDEENLNFGIRTSNKLHTLEIKKLLYINNELFTKNYNEIIWNYEIPMSIESKFYTGKPYYIFKHNIYGNIEFYYTEEGTEIKCKALDSENWKEIIATDIKLDERRLQLYVKTIEKIIEIKEKVLDKMYDFALETCTECEKKDENGNEISKKYIKDHFSKISINIWSKISNKTNEDITEFWFRGVLYDGNGGSLLGVHQIRAIVQGDDIRCTF